LPTNAEISNHFFFLKEIWAPLPWVKLPWSTSLSFIQQRGAPLPFVVFVFVDAFSRQPKPDKSGEARNLTSQFAEAVLKLPSMHNLNLAS
jgi:hypothetical protein